MALLRRLSQAPGSTAPSEMPQSPPLQPALRASKLAYSSAPPCQGCEFLDQFCGDDRGHSVDVTRWIIFDDVGADNRAGQPVKYRYKFTGTEASRLMVRDTGSEGGIEGVEVDADGNRG